MMKPGRIPCPLQSRKECCNLTCCGDLVGHRSRLSKDKLCLLIVAKQEEECEGGDGSAHRIS